MPNCGITKLVAVKRVQAVSGAVRKISIIFLADRSQIVAAPIGFAASLVLGNAVSIPAKVANAISICLSAIV